MENNLLVYDEYCKSFVARVPGYTVKQYGKSEHWKTKHKSLSDRPVQAHLKGKYAVGVYAGWYPEYFIIDIDDAPYEKVEFIKERLGLDYKNSMDNQSESPYSYHVLARPTLNGKPPTARRLNDAFKNFVRPYGLEIFPQRKRTIRLPFSPGFDILNEPYQHLRTWPEKLYHFLMLDEYNIETVERQQYDFDLKVRSDREIGLKVLDAEELLKHGLQARSTRSDAQFEILRYLYRQGWYRETAIKKVFKWIKRKHNGFSRDIVNQREVERQIIVQSVNVWDYFESRNIYPDKTHNNFNGIITKPDIVDIARISEASTPRMKFLYRLVMFSYPRRYRTAFPVHRDRFIEWGSRWGYPNQLRELEEKGIIERGQSYLSTETAQKRNKDAEGFAKSLKVNWPFRDSRQAILYDSRSLDTFDDAVRLTFDPRDFRELLTSAGAKRTTAIMTTKRVFEKFKKE